MLQNKDIEPILGEELYDELAAIYIDRFTHCNLILNVLDLEIIKLNL